MVDSVYEFRLRFRKTIVNDDPRRSMSEVTYAGEAHCDAVLITSIDGLLVTDGSARLNGGGNAVLVSICSYSLRCFFTIFNLVSLVISIKVPPSLAHRCAKNGGNFMKSGGDGGIRTLEPG